MGHLKWFDSLLHIRHKIASDQRLTGSFDAYSFDKE